MKSSVYVSFLSVASQVLTTEALIVGNIKIVGQSGGVAQYLPGSYLNTIPRWTIESSFDESNPEKPLISLTQLVGTGSISPAQTDGVGVAQVVQEFVNPISNEELWWPSDLDSVQVRPTLDVFISSASPTYILAGLEARVPATASKDGKEWKNFGMNSQPLANQWTSFGIAVENGFRVETFIGTRTSSKSDSKGGSGETTDDDVEAIDWEPLYSIDDDEKLCFAQKNDAINETFTAIQTLGGFLAEMDETSPLSTGMHILSIPLDNVWRDLPLPGVEKKEKVYLASVGTVEPDAMEILSMDDDLVAMSATSLLNVDVVVIAPGSKSEYIPNVYKPLYIGQ